MQQETVAFALAGSGGAGVMTIGAMLLEAAARAGYYGLFSRLSGPQVRGGEAAALVHLGTREIGAPPDRYDLLLAIDWGHVERFVQEIPLATDSLIIGDPKMGETPAAIAASGARTLQVAFAAEAQKIPGGRSNMIALGLVAGFAGLPQSAVEGIVEGRIAGKGQAAIDASVAGLKRGYEVAAALDVDMRLPAVSAPAGRWLLTGNQAVGMGMLRGGVRFVAGYPITPATELVEWMAPVLPRLGGQLVQAEDELSAINMALGGAYGGVPSMTATSGPGLSLMVETLGLATAAELPVVVVDVMRGGPSTGIPTKSEQSDLNLAIYGAHGDAPRVVLAPLSIADAIPTAQWSVEIAEALQTPAILLSDQAIGQSRAVIDAPASDATTAARIAAEEIQPRAYKRYALTDSGVSPRTRPGQPNGQWIAEGLTHNEAGTPSSSAQDHHAQLAKRLRKLQQYDFGARWAQIEGEGELAVITWGSTAGAVREALARLRLRGTQIKHIALRLIAPLQTERLMQALAGVQRALVIELNQTAQLHRYLLGHAPQLAPRLSGHARPGPLPFRPAEIEQRIASWSAA
jgi:2-oxoglutarate ferredoxin oxidoreductase subunit alpha